METYYIKYFSAKEKKVTEAIFIGVNAFQDAVNWGKNNLENFNTDLIQKSK